MNEYTDWNWPSEHPINLLDSTVEILGDALVVAPLIRTADLFAKSILRSKWNGKDTLKSFFAYHSLYPPSSKDSDADSGPGNDSENKIFLYVFQNQVSVRKVMISGLVYSYEHLCSPSTARRVESIDHKSATGLSTWRRAGLFVRITTVVDSDWPLARPFRVTFELSPRCSLVASDDNLFHQLCQVWVSIFVRWSTMEQVYRNLVLCAYGFPAN